MGFHRGTCATAAPPGDPGSGRDVPGPVGQAVKKDDRPQLAACLKTLRRGDTLVLWKLDRLGRDLRHLVNVVHDLTERGLGLKVLTGQGVAIDTTTASQKLVSGIFRE